LFPALRACGYAIGAGQIPFHTLCDSGFTMLECVRRSGIEGKQKAKIDKTLQSTYALAGLLLIQQRPRRLDRDFMGTSPHHKEPPPLSEARLTIFITA